MLIHEGEARSGRDLDDCRRAVPDQGGACLDGTSEWVVGRRGSPLAAECVDQDCGRALAAVGDRKPYLVALVTLDPEDAVAYAKEHGLPEDPAELAKDSAVLKAIEAHVEAINQKFARVEQVKKVAILPRDLSQETGELTPTLKVKRAVVASKHQGEIEKLYAS